MRSLPFIGLAGLISAIAAYMLAGYVQGVRQENAVALHAEEVFRSPDSFVAGNPEGDVSIVAFFDYNCPYCREGAPALSKLVAADGKLRLVLKELPVLGPDSEAVARIAQAAIAQGKYFELYERLIAEPGRATKDKALRLASDLGLDTARLEKDVGPGGRGRHRRQQAARRSSRGEGGALLSRRRPDGVGKRGLLRRSRRQGG